MFAWDFNFDKTDILLALDIESCSIDCDETTLAPAPEHNSKILDIRTAKARKSPSILSASWNLCQLRCDLHQANTILAMANEVISLSKKNVRFKKSIDSIGYLGSNTSSNQFDRSLVQITIVQGTFDQPSCEMTIIQMQSVCAVLGDNDEYGGW